MVLSDLAGDRRAETANKLGRVHPVTDITSPESVARLADDPRWTNTAVPTSRYLAPLVRAPRYDAAFADPEGHGWEVAYLDPAVFDR